MKVRRGLPQLRAGRSARAVWHCLARGRERFGLRLIHFSIQRDHLHLIAEAPDRPSLARGIQGLAVRVAKRLNRVWSRKGAVFADRYHDRVLRSPREARAALCYVLNNALHHGRRFHRDGLPCPDPMSSAPWFDGWVGEVPLVPRGAPAPVVPARCWLLRRGWRLHGAIRVDEVPGPRPRQ
jgi:REP element-mobilizing transposase RayT